MIRIFLIIGPVMWLFCLAAQGAEANGTGYQLRPESAETSPGNAVRLNLVYCYVPEVKSGSDSDAPRRPLICEGDKVYDNGRLQRPGIDNVQWNVDGPGSVNGDKNGATYFAPALQPSENEATVSVTLANSASGSMTFLQARIKIIGNTKPAVHFNATKIKYYVGRFRSEDVAVNNEYTRSMVGKISWNFDEYYEEGGWSEYTGTGTATLVASRVGCGKVNFAGVPVEGRMKVYNDMKYEFLINLVGDKEQTRTCRRPELDKNLVWEETFSSGGDAMNSGDPCGKHEFYPSYTEIGTLVHERKGTCDNVMNRFQEGWSFEAVK